MSICRSLYRLVVGLAEQRIVSAELQALARICTKPGATVDDVREACELIRRAANAEDAYVIRAGDPDFIRVGCPCDPAAYEIKQRGYWVVWQVAATNPQFAAGMFDVADRIVSGGVPIRPGRAGSHIGAILPGDDSNSELLILRGPWPNGLTAAQCEFIEAARPIIGVLVSNVLDAQRRARQREPCRRSSDPGWRSFTPIQVAAIFRDGKLALFPGGYTDDKQPLVTREIVDGKLIFNYVVFKVTMERVES
jgi:hypothetical protein